MDAKLELAVLLAFAVIGQSAFARFAGETPAWRKILKWTALIALTLALYRFAGHWSLALPLAFVVIGNANSLRLVQAQRHPSIPGHARSPVLSTARLEVAWRRTRGSAECRNC
jgi:hypothetical protein